MNTKLYFCLFNPLYTITPTLNFQIFSDFKCAFTPQLKKIVAFDLVFFSGELKKRGAPRYKTRSHMMPVMALYGLK